MSYSLRMTPDIQLLINCCKVKPTASDIEHIRSRLTQLETQQLLKIVTLAHNHGVFPLFYQALQTHASDLLSSENLTELKQQNMTIVMNNMQMTAELNRIMRLLENNGIEALAFKGPTLAQLVYGDITLRQYGDLDILVRKEDIYKIDTMLENKGYVRVYKLTSSQEKAWFKCAHDISLFNPNNKINLEIHWSLLDQDYTCRQPTRAATPVPAGRRSRRQGWPTSRRRGRGSIIGRTTGSSCDRIGSSSWKRSGTRSRSRE